MQRHCIKIVSVPVEKRYAEKMIADVPVEKRYADKMIVNVPVEKQLYRSIADASAYAL